MRQMRQWIAAGLFAMALVLPALAHAEVSTPFEQEWEQDALERLAN